jgi:hypothetical protein
MKHLPTITTLIGVWFIVASSAIFWLSSETKAEFDPRLELSQSIMSLSFEQELITQLHSISMVAVKPEGPLKANSEGERTQMQPTIYHVTQGQCYCEYVSSPHKSALQKWSTDSGFTNINVDINLHPNLLTFIPSTPAVIAISGDNSLIYLGPYSRGMGCFANNGQVDEFLAKWISQDPASRRQHNALIDTDATGCYCET